MAETLASAYRENFGCLLDDGDEHGHEGACQLAWMCGTCGRDIGMGHCPDHAPTEIPGLELAVCSADPPHQRTFLYQGDGGYPAPCMYCAYDAARKAHEGCAHSHHRVWHRWKLTHWLAFKGAMAGFVKPGVISWGGGCNSCMVGTRLGRTGYVLGKRREWWSCLLRRRHLFKPVHGIGWLCDTCSPDPDGNPEATR